MWTPPPDVLERTRIGAYLGVVGIGAWPPLRWGTRTSGNGRSTTSTGSGRRWPSGPGCGGTTGPSGRWRSAGCPARAGSRAPRSTTRSRRWRAAETRATRSRSSPGARPAPDPSSRGASCVDLVARCRAGLQRLGVGPGDRVAAYLPNIPETLIAFLATASLGAIWSSCAPEFGTRSVIDRFAQIEPVVLLAVDGYRYGAKIIDRAAEVADDRSRVADACATTVHLSYLGDRRPTTGRALLAEPAPPAFDPVPFDHPLYVLYSSGTTGLPEGDRARPRRHHRRAPEDARAAPRHRGRRPVLLVHHHRLDDVELPRVGAARRARRSCCSTAIPAYPDLSTLWRLAAETRLRRVRDERAVHHGVPQGGRRAGRTATAAPAAQHRVDRLAAAGRRASAGCTTRSVPTCSWLDERRHRRVHGVRRRGAARCRCARARSAAGCSVCAVEAFDADGHRARRRAGRARDHRADAVDAGRASGATPTARSCGTPTSPTTRACGATATGSRSPTTAPA